MTSLVGTKTAQNVFFSAPATNDDSEKELYQLILDEISFLGYKITYDWVNDKNDFDPKSTTAKSIKAIEISDLVIAENTTPSTGVGGQIALAQARKIPVIILTRKDGDENNGFFRFSDLGSGVFSYEYTINNLRNVLREATVSVSKNRFVKFNFISTPAINQALEEESAKQNISKSDYLRKLLEEHFKI